MSNVRASIGVGLLLGLTLSVLLMLMATASAQAQTEDVCEVQFNQLRAHLAPEALPITGVKADKERVGLLKLVDDAQNLASIGKTSDAVKKLGDFTVKIDQLEAAGRISAESADQLRSDAQASTVCLQDSEASMTVGAVN